MSRSVFIEKESSSRRNPNCFASAADVATFASAIVSNARLTNGNGSASETPAGIESSARTSISFVPPPAGIKPTPTSTRPMRSEEHTSELQSRQYLVCRLLLEKKKKKERDGADVVMALENRS